MRRFQAQKKKDDTASYIRDSDSDNDLNWLGDLLDPWKDSREDLKNLTTISTKNAQAYRNKNYEDRLIPQIKQLQYSSFCIKSQDKANSPTRISKDFIVLDEEESFKETKPSYFLHHTHDNHNEKRQITEQHSVQHPLNSYEDEQQDQQVSFSMLFRHPFTNSQAKDKTFHCEQSTKREEKIKQQQKTSKRAQNNNSNKVKFHDQIRSDERQVIEYFPSLKKKTHKRYKAVNKKLKIPPSQRHQLEENIILIDQRNQKNPIKEKKSFLRKQNLMKLQANKDVNLIECEQVQISFQEQDGINDAHSINFGIKELEQAQKQNFKRNQEQGYVQNQQYQTRNDFIDSSNNIGFSKRQKRLNQKQQQIANELNEIIRIVGVRDNGKAKQYKWEIGTQSFWKSIGQALSSNFQIFIRTSKKYKNKFLKYLPKNIIQKKQSYNKFECRLEDQSISKIKLEKIREYKIRSKNRQMYDLKDIFDKVLLSKIIQYEKFIEEKGSQYARQEFEDGIFSEYEPDSYRLECMIDDIVANTNKSFRQRRCENNKISQKQKELKATNQLLIQNLNKATEAYNFIDSMKQLYNLNTKHPTLSCLDQKGLGLRSKNLKVIDKATFEQEMNRIRLMKEAIQLNDSDSNPIIQSSEKFEAEKKHISLKLQ